jgi:asparagine synthase (glutamine-hydrolysing)
MPADVGQATGRANTGTVAWLAGFLDETPLLARELGADPSTPAPVLLAEAFDRHGDAFLGGLRGSYALAVWSPTRAAGLLAVDHLGGGSLFLRTEGSHLLFSPELRPLVAGGPAPQPDPTSLVLWVANGRTARGATLFEDISRLPGGEAVHLSPEGWAQRPYWVPTYRAQRRGDRKTLASGLREVVETAVERRVARSGRTGVLVSGGLDSATVAAAARTRGHLLPAYSAVFPTHPSVDESVLIAELVAGLGIPSTVVRFSSGSMIPAALRYLDDWGVPSPSPNLFFHEPLLAAAREDGIELLLDGQGGDELFGASPYLVADRLRHGHPISALRLAAELVGRTGLKPTGDVRRALVEFGLKGLLPASAHDGARRVRGASVYAPDWLGDRAGATYAGARNAWQWKRSGEPASWSYLSDLLIAGRERGGVHEFLRRMLASAALAGAHPLLDDVDLVEFVLSLPPELAFDAHLSRPLLRDAMAGLMPDGIRLRPTKSYFDELFHGTLNQTDWAPIRSVLTSGDAAIADYVDPVGIRTLLDRPAQRRRGSTAWTIWRLFGAECWLRGLSGRALHEPGEEPWRFEPLRFDVERLR